MNARFLFQKFLAGAFFILFCSKNPIENNFPTGVPHEATELPDTAANQSADTSTANESTEDSASTLPDTVNPDISTASQMDSSYFPLHLGDFWHYGVAEIDPLEVTVVDTSQINSETYFVARYTQGKYSSERLFRLEAGILYEYLRGNTIVLVDFNKPVGEKWKHPEFNRFSWIESNSETIGWLFNRVFDNCIILVDESDVDITRKIYVEGIGLVLNNIRFYNGGTVGGDTYYLKKAVINGNEFSSD